MNYIIATILVLFTIIQVFYFALVDIIPNGILTSITLIQILIYVAEAVLLLSLSIFITYILPIICVVEIVKLNIQLKKIQLPSTLRTNNTHELPTVIIKNIQQKLQVIRC